MVFQSLPRSRDAAFSAAINLVNVSRGPCTEGTRVDIIEQIMEWAKETDPVKAPSVYWLNGLAGLGKTTIAYTICELLEKAGVPFASFFCSIQLDSKNSKLSQHYAATLPNNTTTSKMFTIYVNTTGQH